MNRLFVARASDYCVSLCARYGRVEQYTSVAFGVAEQMARASRLERNGRRLEDPTTPKERRPRYGALCTYLQATGFRFYFEIC